MIKRLAIYLAVLVLVAGLAWSAFGATATPIESTQPNIQRGVLTFTSSGLGLTLPSAPNTAIATSDINFTGARSAVLRIRVNNTAATNPTGNIYQIISRFPTGDTRPFATITPGFTGNSTMTLTMNFHAQIVNTGVAGGAGVNFTASPFLVPSITPLSFDAIATTTYEQIDLQIQY